MKPKNLSLLYENTAINALGQPIHPSKEGIENFWRWFDGSEMKNRKGQPCVFYHGTVYNFSKFIPQKIIGQLEGDNAVFFTTKEKFAVSFAQERLDNDKNMGVNSLEDADKMSGISVYSVYLRSKKPFNFRNKKCIESFLEYVRENYPNIEDRIGSRNDSEIRSRISGEYIYSYTDNLNNLKVGDLIKAYGKYKPLRKSEIIRPIENDEIPSEVLFYTSLNYAIVFYKGQKSVLAYSIDIITKRKDICYPSKFKVITKNREIVERINNSGIKIKSGEKRLPFNIELEVLETGEKIKVQSDIVLLKITEEDRAKKVSYKNNWEEIEDFLISEKESFVSIIKKLGYDSFFTLEDGTLNIAIFNSNDIKSIENNGKFSESDNIFE